MQIGMTSNPSGNAEPTYDEVNTTFVEKMNKEVVAIPYAAITTADCHIHFGQLFICAISPTQFLLKAIAGAPIM
jgi:hypothetical protein